MVGRETSIQNKRTKFQVHPPVLTELLRRVRSLLNIILFIKGVRKGLAFYGERRKMVGKIGPNNFENY